MATKSRFLRQGSTPPSSISSRSFRASSAAPSRNFRERSVASLRATSVAPLRASSVAPLRASSMAPVRASCIAPSRASSVAPMRASSVTPYYRSTVRASSVSPYSSLLGSSSSRSTYGSSRGMRASSLSPQSLPSFRSTTLTPKSNISYRIDTSLPTRQFGTRLGIHKVETAVKPAIYDEYYGMTYVPSSGRDSWSAYRISDETLDDNDDLVYESAKKDHEVMKRVNKQIVEAMNVQPPVYVPVAPAHRRFAPQPTPTIIQVPADVKLNNAVPYKRTPRGVPVVYKQATISDPVNISYTSSSNIYSGSSALAPRKQKAAAFETVDFGQPATFKNLKERLRGARDFASQNKASTNYSGDSDLRAIDSEVRAIKNARNMREESLGPNIKELMAGQRASSDLRKRIRATLRKTRI